MANTKRRKFTDKEKKEIIANYIECQNYSKVADKYNVSIEAIRNVVKNDKEFGDKLRQKKEENTLTTLEYMDTQHETKKRVLDKLLKGIELKADDIEHIDKMNIKDLATAYGIILDKELKVLELKAQRDNNEIELAKVDELLKEIKNVSIE